MGDHLIITVENKDDLKAKYTSALKALALLGIKIKTKEPQAAKLTGDLSKAKPGEFTLSADAKAIKLVFKHNKAVQVLGMIDPAVVESIEDLKRIEKATGVSYKDRIAKLEAHEHAPSKADPRAVKQADADVTLATKARDDLKAHHAALGKLTWETISKHPVLGKQFDQFAKTIQIDNEVDFLKDYARGEKPDKLFALYMDADNPKARLVNGYDNDMMEDLSAKRKDELVATSYRKVLSNIQSGSVPRFVAAVQKPTADRLAQAEQDLKHLQGLRAKLNR